MFSQVDLSLIYIDLSQVWVCLFNQWSRKRSTDQLWCIFGLYNQIPALTNIVVLTSHRNYSKLSADVISRSSSDILATGLHSQELNFLRQWNVLLVLKVNVYFSESYVCALMARYIETLFVDLNCYRPLFKIMLCLKDNLFCV